VNDFYYVLIYIMSKIMNRLSHYGDILAIPFFALLINYFYNIEKKTQTEYLLFIFAILGFILDILYTIIFIKSSKV
jgi:hypothetical protein